MAGRDRSGGADGRTLGARLLIQEIGQVARAKHLVGYRVAYKQNAKGEHVVALIYPLQPP